MIVHAIADRDNAALMLDCYVLGYIRQGDGVLDATYGLGRFWNDYKPKNLHRNDLNPGTDADTHYDFRAFPFCDRSFDVVVLDPPYKLNGTPSRGGPASLDVDYGVGQGYVAWRARHEMIDNGIIECARLAGRVLLVKCMDQVSSGKVRWQTFEFARVAIGEGFDLIDMLHVPGERVQPEGRRQVHARRNYSTLLVLQRRGTK